MRFRQPFHVLITRPREQAEALKVILEQLGLVPIVSPLLEIIPRPYQWALQEKTGILVFTSQAAVRYGLPGIQNLDLTTWDLWAIGNATKEALKASCAQAISCPQPPYNSEQLLTESSFKRLSGRTVVLFQGVKPRPLLAQTLRRRQALVSQYFVYERQLRQAAVTELQSMSLEPRRAVILITSGDALEYLISLLQMLHLEEWFSTCPLLLVSPRLAEMARIQGFKRIYLSQGACHHAIVQALNQHQEAFIYE